MILFRRILFSLASLASVSAAVYFSFVVAEPNYGMTGIWLTFSLFTFAFGWPEIAESISFLGNNIKLREVKNAINELKQLAEVNVAALLEIIQTQMRFGGVPEDKKEEVFQQTTVLLKNLGFDKNEIEGIQSRWHFWVEGDYVRALIHNNINHPEIPKERHEEWHAKRKELQEKTNDLTPDELRDVFKIFDGDTETVKQVIDDLEYYKKHKKHKDIERWKKHEEWFKA
jgi:hypothetical protein